MKYTGPIPIPVNEPEPPEGTKCEFRANNRPCQYPQCECGYGPGTDKDPPQ
jgi:hypothetical protein